MKKNILIVACYINLSFASTTIDQQIEAIRDAPSSQRVEMMNTLKRQLILMNQVERQQTIAKLRENSPQTAPITPQIPTMIRDRVEYRAVQNNENSILVTQETKQQTIHSINAKIPEIKTPEVKMPEQIPEIKTPEVNIHEQVPETQIPENIRQEEQNTPQEPQPIQNLMGNHS